MQLRLLMLTEEEEKAEKDKECCRGMPIEALKLPQSCSVLTVLSIDRSKHLYGNSHHCFMHYSTATGALPTKWGNAESTS